MRCVLNSSFTPPLEAHACSLAHTFWGTAQAAASSLAETIATFPRLKTIDLQRNKIRCQGAIALAAALQVQRCR